jgi:aminoglycoside phosphotransferase (APT) family kinase protein
MVMDRANGVPLLAGMDSVAGLLAAPRRLWRMPDHLARTMAELHAVDPSPVRKQLAEVDGIARTIPEMLEHLASRTDAIGREDLGAATSWMMEHPLDGGDEVICHGDLHPYNVLVDDDGGVTLLDWSAALLAPRGYDVAFTSLMLGSSPLAVPAPVRPLVRAVGRGLASRFLGRYRWHSDHVVERTTLDWFQAVVCLRALAEVAGWEHDGLLQSRVGHPWLVSGPQFAAHLGAVTGLQVRSL